MLTAISTVGFGLVVFAYVFKKGSLGIGREKTTHFSQFHIKLGSLMPL